MRQVTFQRNFFDVNSAVIFRLRHKVGPFLALSRNYSNKKKEKTKSFHFEAVEPFIGLHFLF